MKSTTITATHGQIVRERAYGYKGTYPNFEVRMPNYDLTGPTNLLTTVEDLIKWDRNFDSKIVGGDAAIQAMLTPVTASKGYGLGLIVGRDRPPRPPRWVIEHNGRDAVYRSHRIRYPDQQLTVALLCNLALPESISTSKLVRDVADVFLAEPHVVEPRSSGDVLVEPLSSGVGVVEPLLSEDVSEAPIVAANLVDYLGHTIVARSIRPMRSSLDLR